MIGFNKQPAETRRYKMSRYIFDFFINKVPIGCVNIILDTRNISQIQPERLSLHKNNAIATVDSFSVIPPFFKQRIFGDDFVYRKISSLRRILHVHLNTFRLLSEYTERMRMRRNKFQQCLTKLKGQFFEKSEWGIMNLPKQRKKTEQFYTNFGTKPKFFEILVLYYKQV